MKKLRIAGGVMACAMATLSSPGTAQAAPPVRSLGALGSRVPVGTEVVVTDHEGRAFVGTFVLADEDGVLIDVPGARKGRRMVADDVATVTRVGDSWARGIVIGAGAAVLPGIAFATTQEADRITCPYRENCQPWCSSDGCRIAGGISIVALGAAIGAIVDRRTVGREIVYSAVPRQVTWRLTPHPVSRGAGVRLAVRF